MCNAFAVVGLQAAGAINSTVGSYFAAGAQRDGLRMGAEMDERAAQAQLLAGERDEQRSRLSTARLKGSQRTALAAGGFDLADAGAARLLTSTDVLGEDDALTIRNNALRSAWGYRTDAAMKTAAADSIKPGLVAATTLLGEGAQVASSWYSMSKAGAFGTSGQYDARAPIRGQRGYG